MIYRNYVDFLQQRTLKVRSVDVSGLGTFDIHELSAAQTFAVDDAIRSASPADAETKIAEAVLLMLKGSAPTKKEVEQLRNNHSGGVISRIYSAGIAASLHDHTSAKDLEKNS